MDLQISVLNLVLMIGVVVFIGGFGHKGCLAMRAQSSIPRTIHLQIAFALRALRCYEWRPDNLPFWFILDVDLYYSR